MTGSTQVCAQFASDTSSNVNLFFIPSCGQRNPSVGAEVPVIPNRKSTVVHRQNAQFLRRFPPLIPRVLHRLVGVRSFEGVPLEIPAEMGGRSGTPTSRTVLHPPLAFILGGTLIEPTRGRAEAARKHLNVMRSRVAVDLAEAIMYVNLSFTYGLEVSEISDESGMPVELVRRILLGRL